jgi:hypothetical protein
MVSLKDESYRLGDRDLGSAPAGSVTTGGPSSTGTNGPEPPDRARGVRIGLGCIHIGHSFARSDARISRRLAERGRAGHARAKCNSGVMARSRDVAMWDARAWVAGLLGCDPTELIVRSTDTYGTETQVRYERGGEAVARLTVAPPVQSFSDAVGKGHRSVTAQLGAGTYKVHKLAVPESDEIDY